MLVRIGAIEADSCSWRPHQSCAGLLQGKQSGAKVRLAIKDLFSLSKTAQLSNRRRWLALCCSPNGALLR